MLKLGLRNEGGTGPSAKDQYVEPARMVGDDQRVSLEWIAFKARPDTGDKARMAQEPWRPARFPQHQLRQQVRLYV